MAQRFEAMHASLFDTSTQDATIQLNTVEFSALDRKTVKQGGEGKKDTHMVEQTQKGHRIIYVIVFSPSITIITLL